MRLQMLSDSLGRTFLQRTKGKVKQDSKRVGGERESLLCRESSKWKSENSANKKHSEFLEEQTNKFYRTRDLFQQEKQGWKEESEVRRMCQLHVFVILLAL
jgi:hypothetical protein